LSPPSLAPLFDVKQNPQSATRNLWL